MSAPIRGQRRPGTPSLVLPGDPDGCGWFAIGGGEYVPFPSPPTGHPARERRTVRYVGRPTRWGNPTIVKRSSEGNWYVADSQNPDKPHEAFGANAEGKRDAYETAAYDYDFMLGDLDVIDLARFVAPLVGADVLSCWCPLGSPCHANALCELVGRLKSGDLVPGLVATPGVCGGALRIDGTEWAVAQIASNVSSWLDAGMCRNDMVLQTAATYSLDPDLVRLAARVGGAL